MLVQICRGRACTERHSQYIMSRLEADKAFYQYSENVHIEACLCQGRCKEGPTVVFDGEVEVHMNPIRASEYLRKKVREAKQVLFKK